MVFSSLSGDGVKWCSDCTLECWDITVSVWRKNIDSALGYLRVFVKDRDNWQTRDTDPSPASSSSVMGQQAGLWTLLVSFQRVCLSDALAITVSWGRTTKGQGPDAAHRCSKTLSLTAKHEGTVAQRSWHTVLRMRRVSWAALPFVLPVWGPAFLPYPDRRCPRPHNAGLHARVFLECIAPDLCVHLLCHVSDFSHWARNALPNCHCLRALLGENTDTNHPPK